MSKKLQWGITSGAHDASIAVIQDNNKILFAAHAERSSRKKNDAYLNSTVFDQALEFGKPDNIYWYENTFKKRLRQLWAGQYPYSHPQSHPLIQAGVCVIWRYMFVNCDHGRRHIQYT